MLIIYTCPNCNANRYFTSNQTSDVLCKKCNTKMTTPKSNIAIEVMSTEEARFLGDEAIYNTIGSRISDKHSKHFASKF